MADNKMGSSSRRTSVRLKGRSHPRLYNSDHEEEEDEQIQVVPAKKRQRDSKSKSVERASSQESSISVKEEEDNDSVISLSNGGESQKSFLDDEDEDYMNQIPSALAAIFSETSNPPSYRQESASPASSSNTATDASEKRTRRNGKTPLANDDETNRRVLKILRSVPSHREIEKNPELQQLATRKPYAKRSGPHFYANTNSSTAIYFRDMQRKRPHHTILDQKFSNDSKSQKDIVDLEHEEDEDKISDSPDSGVHFPKHVPEKSTSPYMYLAKTKNDSVNLDSQTLKTLNSPISKALPEKLAELEGTKNPEKLPISKLLLESEAAKSLEKLAELEGPKKKDFPDEKGILLSSVSDTSEEYKKIEANENEEEEIVEKEWTENENDLQHECPMVEFMCEKIHDSKQQTQKAWETVRETLQKLRDKEQLIQELRHQLQNEKMHAGLTEGLTRSLREANNFVSYATMLPAARRNAQFVFYMTLQQAFPNFSHQDLKQIFQDSICSPHQMNQFAIQKARLASEISKEMEQIDEEIMIEKASQPNMPQPSILPPSIKISRGTPIQQVKTMPPLTMAPLAVIPRNTANVTQSKAPIPQLLPKQQNGSVGKPPKKVLMLASKKSQQIRELSKEREREILKMHPALQYASPVEKAKYMDKGEPPQIVRSQKTMEIVRPKIPPTLIRKFHSPTNIKAQKVIPNDFHKNSTDPLNDEDRRVKKRVIPLRFHGSSWQFLGGDGPRHLILSKKKQSVQDMAEATERLQRENKKRLEALLPIKTEPQDLV